MNWLSVIIGNYCDLEQFVVQTHCGFSMKKMILNIKWAANLLSFLILLQSCTIYHKYTSSAQEAADTSLKVKIKIPGEETYVYKRLKIIDDEIYGLTRPKSTTARRMQNQVVDKAYEGKFALVELNDDELQHIHMTNAKATLTTLIVLDAVLLTLILIPWY